RQVVVDQQKGEATGHEGLLAPVAGSARATVRSLFRNGLILIIFLLTVKSHVRVAESGNILSVFPPLGGACGLGSWTPWLLKIWADSFLADGRRLEETSDLEFFHN
ncbi:MAG: hypothetical protein RBT64_02415, partial [Trichloromonas sp.]|nr:hypothetical protein [Trichloromonas sp.]